MLNVFSFVKSNFAREDGRVFFLPSSEKLNPKKEIGTIALVSYQEIENGIPIEPRLVRLTICRLFQIQVP